MGLLQTIQRGAKRLKDQLDPFDGGKTWQNPTPQARPQANPYSRNQYNGAAGGGNLQVAPVRNPALDIKPAPEIQIPTQPLQVTTAKTPELSVGNKKIATSIDARTAPTGLVKQTQRAVDNFKLPESPTNAITREFVTRPIAEVAATISGKTIKPTNPVTKSLVGDQPVKPIQETVRGTYRAVKSGGQTLPGGIPIPQNLAPEWAAANAVLHIANDAPVVSGVGKVGLTATGKAAKGIEKLSNSAAGQQVVKALDSVPVGMSIKKTPPKPTNTATVENMATDLKQAQTEAEGKIMQPKGLEKVRAAGRKVSAQAFNPYSEAERFNSLVAKSQDVPLKNLKAADDLAHNLDATGNSGVYAKSLAENSGLANIIGKHKPGSKEESQFVTWMAMKRDLNTRANKGVEILPFDTEDMAKAAAQYEAKHPEALADLQKVNDHFKTVLQNAVNSGRIAPEDYAKAVASEDYYAPIARILGSEDVLRPTINANVKGSLGKQTALQTLKGSDRPINTSWEAIVNANTKNAREDAQNRAFNVIYRAADKKEAEAMVKMGMSKEQSKSLLDLRATIEDLQNAGKTARSKAKMAQRETTKAYKKQTAFQNRVHPKAIESLAKNMEALDPDGAAAIRNLGKKDQAKLTQWLADGMTDTEIARGNKLNAAARASYARLMALREEAEGLAGRTNDAKTAARGLQIVKNEKTGRQVLNGFVDGYPVWVETTPDMAKMIQGLEPRELDIVSRNLTKVQHVWRTFWTGLFNPLFAAKSKFFYDPAMMAINQPGARNQLRPKAWGGALADNFTDLGGFFEKLKPYGVSPVTGSRMMGDTKQTAKLLASHKNFQSKLGYYAAHPGDALQALDVFGGRLAHSSRMQVARAEYLKGLANKLSEEDALMNAARAYNNVLPNYARTSKLLKTLDAWIPYSNAGVAGTRAMITAARKHPAGFATKAGAFTAALGAVGTYALGDEATRDFYQDLYETNKQSILQNNLVFALPGAHKNPDTGEWTGIVKIPIPPEFRAPNAIVQQEIAKRAGVDTKGYNPVVGAVSTAASGGVLNIGRGGGPNAELNPGLSSLTELVTNKRNMGTGDSFAYGDTQFLPRNEQINKDTSQFAITAARNFNKLPVGDISPAALDAQLKSFGPGGKAIRAYGSKLTADKNTSKDRLPSAEFGKTTKGIISADGTKGATEATRHFKNQDDIRDSLKTKALKDQFDMINSKSNSPGDAGAKASALYESLQTDGKLWNAQKQQNDRDAKTSGISNPIFSLSKEQARAVLLYRSNSRMNAARQTYAKDGSSLFQSLGLDERWYQDFKKAEDGFYKQIDSKKKGDSETNSNVTAAAKTYAGNKYEEAPPALQSKLNQYYDLPKGTGERSAFLKANPDIIKYWDKQNSLANEERAAMGLDPLDENGDGFGSFSKYSKSGGKGNKFTASDVTNPYSSIIKTVGALNKKVGSSKIKAAPLKSKVKKPGIRKK